MIQAPDPPPSGLHRRLDHDLVSQTQPKTFMILSRDLTQAALGSGESLAGWSSMNFLTASPLTLPHTWV